MPNGSLDDLRDEIVRLRDWRHDVAMPELVAARERVKQLAEHLKMVDRRLDDMQSKLDRMARADEIAEAVTSHARHSRRGILNAWEKLVIGLAAIAGTVSTVLQVVHH